MIKSSLRRGFFILDTFIQRVGSKARSLLMRTLSQQQDYKNLMLNAYYHIVQL